MTASLHAPKEKYKAFIAMQPRETVPYTVEDHDVCVNELKITTE